MKQGDTNAPGSDGSAGGETSSGRDERSKTDALWSVREGSTEIWADNQLVGVAFRMPNTDEEHVFMFADGLLNAGNGTDPSLKIGPYSPQLAPHAQPDLSAAGASHRVEPLKKCPVGQPCTECGGQNTCFGSIDAFRDTDPGKGVWSVLQTRMGSTSPAVVDVPRWEGTGTISYLQAPFNPTNCVTELNNLPSGPGGVHVDKIKAGAQPVGWNWVSVVSPSEQHQLLVSEGIVLGDIPHYRHVNDAVPADSQNPPPGSMDDWCAAVASACAATGLNCEMTRVDYTYP